MVFDVWGTTCDGDDLLGMLSCVLSRMPSCVTPALGTLSPPVSTSTMGTPKGGLRSCGVSGEAEEGSLGISRLTGKKEIKHETLAI